MSAPRIPPVPPIPWIVGNLGASAIAALARGEPPPRHPLLDDLKRLADLGFTAVEDYVGWSVLEPERGRIDPRLHLEHRRAADAAGLRYVVYPWLHAMPRWMLDPLGFEPWRCLAHGLPLGAPTPFSPRTLELLERFYGTIAAHLGPIDACTVAAPCDYGEAGFPTGMGTWVVVPPAGLNHAHEGYWCGDPAARADFRAAMLARHGGLAPLNEAWGTRFHHEADVAPFADPAAAELRDRYRLDFVRWYRTALRGFYDGAFCAARAAFPKARLALKFGYAGEKATYGQDYAGLAEVARRHGADVWSTHGTLPVVFHKRIQTICRALGVAYVTEGVTERSADQVLDRLFEDAADGAAAFFEFHETFVEFEPLFMRHAPLLRGEAPDVDVALWFNGALQDLEPEQALPPGLQALAEPLRDLLDYEIVGEDLLDVATDALARYGVIVLPDPEPAPPAMVARLDRFVNDGGLLVVPEPALDPFRDAPLFFRGEPADAPDRLELRFAPGWEWLRAGRYEGFEAATACFADAGVGEVCAWTGGRAGFRLPADGATGWRLAVELFAHPAARPEEWRLCVAGAEVARVERPGASVVVADLPRGLLAAAGALEVVMAGPTFRPVDGAEPSLDRRPLGLLLRKVTLSRAGAAADPAGAALDPRFRLDAEPDVARLCAHHLERRGRGGVLRVPAGDLMALAAATHAASARRSLLLDGAKDFPQFACRRDGVRRARFGDRVLAYDRAAGWISAASWERGRLARRDDEGIQAKGS